MPKVRIVLCLLFLTGCFGAKGNAQEIVIDWRTKTLERYPARVNRTMRATILVNNVNDVLYGYEINLVAIPRQPDDASVLGKLLPKEMGARNRNPRPAKTSFKTHRTS